jgi:hypothetical protein
MRIIIEIWIKKSKYLDGIRKDLTLIYLHGAWCMVHGAICAESNFINFAIFVLINISTNVLLFAI